MNFAWGGAIWVAGGLDFTSGTPFTDVWGSYDFGRTWTQPVDNNGRPVLLRGPCAADNDEAVVYAGAVYLFCSDAQQGHYLGTMMSTSLTLTSWAGPTDDGYPDFDQSFDFPINRMAVPFDGVGTLIAVNPGNYNNYIFWYSATGNFQPTIDTNGGGPIAGSGTVGHWTPFTLPGATDPFTTPWLPRGASRATVDAEGLQLIMTGGGTFDGSGVQFNDVWQLTWQSSFVAPLISQLTDRAQFVPRTQFLLATVHDWYFLAGGITVDSNGYGVYLDDVWMSGDLGTTWSLYAGVANSGPPGATGGGAAFLNRVTLGRRLFIIAPSRSYGGSLSNDVFELVW